MKQDNKKHPKKWFDAECYKLRKETKRYATLKQKSYRQKTLHNLIGIS